MRRELLRFISLLIISGTFVTATHAGKGLIGRHRISIDFGGGSAAGVLDFLSERSKSVSTFSDEKPWGVRGLDLLNEEYVRVKFVATPVEDIVRQLLGCVGFQYVERGTYIEVSRADRVFTAEQCPNVVRIPRVRPGS